MKRTFLFISAIILIIIFIGYMISFQVNFDQSAILITFGKVSENNVINADGSDAGLHLKYPWPIQKVKTFDRRLFILNDRLEQQETNDKQVVILKTYVAWKIVNPLDFYRSLRDIEGSERFLKERLRSARSEVGRFAFDDLTNVNPQKLKIKEVEAAMLKRMMSDLSQQNCGITIKTLGITRIILPKQITTSVFERMKRTRQRIAQTARSQGDAIARRIRGVAERDKARIMSFAEQEAQSIRAEGDAGAAKYYKIFNENKEFALYLRKLEALEKTLSNNTTFMLDTQSIPFDVLEEINVVEPGKRNKLDVKNEK